MWEVILLLGMFTISFLVGYVLISRVPQRLHTPLMSMTNAISAVTILGAMLLFSLETTPVEKVLGCVALAFAAFNVVGGFVITHRMVGLFKTKNRSP
jgi:H+-translocating NAD(P) transhydrogenase subunit alpha